MISTRGRYALRVMLDLATQNSDTFIPLSEIATRQDISIKYLEIILKNLVAGGLLTGQRGKSGGYKLTKSPSEINVCEILELSEGTLAPVACLSTDSGDCPRKGACQTLPMWTKFDNMVHDFFSGITLADIIEESGN